MPLEHQHLQSRKIFVSKPPASTDKQTQVYKQTHCNNIQIAGGIRMENQSGRARDCVLHQTGGDWLFPVLRSLTQLGFSVWPPMKQETMRGTSM